MSINPDEMFSVSTRCPLLTTASFCTPSCTLSCAIENACHSRRVAKRAGLRHDRDQAFAFPLAGHLEAGLHRTLLAMRRFNETTGLLLPANGLRLRPLTGWFSQARMPPCAGNAPRPVTDGGAAPPAPRS